MTTKYFLCLGDLKIVKQHPILTTYLFTSVQLLRHFAERCYENAEADGLEVNGNRENVKKQRHMFGKYYKQDCHDEKTDKGGGTFPANHQNPKLLTLCRRARGLSTFSTETRIS